MRSDLVFHSIKYEINLNDRYIKLPTEVNVQINLDWSTYITDNPQSFNGDLYTIEDIKYINDKLVFEVYKTKYSHFIYTKNLNFKGENLCRSIASSVLITTSDDYLVFGKMSLNTTFKNIIKLIGGAFSNEDMKQNKENARNCALRELKEEVGLDYNSYKGQLSDYLIATRHNLSFINFIFLLKSKLTKSEITNLFETYKTRLINRGDYSELNSLVFVKNNKKDIINFLDNTENRLISYLKEVMLVHINQLMPGNLIEYIEIV
ncbi:hypothetical protein BK010_07750 [Tenericutes bacterium MO-XQ]|nr:hypothetical protein BK010_07750 [Tenericutes bacterium MO-XQ]